MAETALICRVPEAERYIGHHRQRFDPPARRNVPAHVTVLYPFMDSALIDEQVMSALGEVAGAVPCFEYRLRETRRFPSSLYLAPEPGDGYTALTQGVHGAFPEYPPFAGKFATVVPHVTVAHGDEAQLCEIEIELRIALPGSGVPARCGEMVLIEFRSPQWEVLRTFSLGASR